MRRKTTFLIVLGLSLLCAPPAPAAELSAKEIVRRSDDLMRGDTNQGTYRMTVTTPAWQRELKLSVTAVGRDRTFIRILSPAKEAGIGTLRIGNEMWNYLPAVEKTIKIPPSMMLQPWMGSEFSNDDLVKESSLVDDYTHQIIDQGVYDGHRILKIELRPKPGAPVIWGRILRWIRADDYVPLKESYFGDNGDLVKILTFSDIGPVSDRKIPRVWTMTSQIRPGHQTVIRLLDVRYNQPVDPDVFTLTHLKKIQ